MNNILQLICLVFLLTVSTSDSLYAQVFASSEDKKTDPSLFHKFQPDQPQMNLQYVLKALEKKHSVSIAYRAELVEHTWIKKVELQGKSTAEEDLQKVLKDSGLRYKLADKNFYIIYLRDNETDKKLHGIKPISPDGQNLFLMYKIKAIGALEKTISGTVSDEDGQALPGVNVVVKGTSTGTITDIQVKYQLTVANVSVTLVFTFVGYQSEEVIVGKQSVVDVIMMSDIKSLSEIVVTALGFEGDAPRMNHSGSSLPTGSIMTDGGILYVEEGFSYEVVRELIGKGHEVSYGHKDGFGGYQGIKLDWENKVYYGASESRKDGYAGGY